jgi:DNA polymerase III delta subunit
MGTAITGLEKEKKGYYIITNGYNKKVLLTKSIMQGNRVKYNVILAILDFDNLNKNEEIILQECRLNKKNDNLIIAIVEKINNQKYYYKVIKAFRLNPNNNTFNPISTIGIDCLNIEYYN